MNSVVKEQHPFWDEMNKIELPFVIFVQKIGLARELAFFHEKFQFYLGTKFFSFYPLLLYSLGLESGVKLARSIVFYSLLSAISKFSIPRLRPMFFEGVYAKKKCSSSSFPSRHSIAATIFADIFPNVYFRWILIVTMLLNRIISGKHYLSDTIAGLLVGKLCIYLRNRITNPIILTLCGLLGILFWPKGSRSVGCSLPLLFIPSEWHCRPYSCVVAFAFYYIHHKLRDFLNSKTSNRFIMLSFEVVFSAMAVLACTYFNIDFLFENQSETNPKLD